MTDAQAAQLLGLNNGVIPAWTQGILLTDPDLPDNPIVYANSGFMTLTGYRREEIVGRNCRFLQGKDSSAQTVSAIREAIASSRRFDGDVLNYRRDGTPFWNCLSLGPLQDETGKRYFVGLQFDVTFRHRAG
jgi:PAS domain S-box-containing protein